MADDTGLRHKRGGLYFEGFEVGKLYEHRYTRTVTQMDNMLFSNMTLNPQPLHIDRHFCETETEWGQPLMNSLFTLGLMIGMSVSDISTGTTIANLGMQETRFPNPVFENDTLHASTEIIGKRESKSRPDAGIVTNRRGLRLDQFDDAVCGLLCAQAFSLRPVESSRKPAEFITIQGLLGVAH